MKKQKGQKRTIKEKNKQWLNTMHTIYGTVVLPF